MIAGHFATALVPYSRLRDAPLWLLLLAAQSLDFLWFLFATLGLEPTQPESFLDVAGSQVRVEMIYSHSGVGALVFAAVIAGAAHAVYRRAALSLACAALVVAHWCCDLLSGFAHEIALAGSPKVGFNLYVTHPEVAIGIEAVFAGVIVAWYVRSEKQQGRALSPRWIAALTLLFVGGALMFLPTARTPLRQTLGL